MNKNVSKLFTVIGVIATVSTAIYVFICMPLMYVQKIEHQNHELKAQVLKLEERISEYEAECESEECEWKGYKTLEPCYSRLMVNE